MYAIGLIERFEIVEPGRAARAFARFPEGHPAFAGHFPDAPILAGVLQIGLMLETAERLLGHAIEIAEIRQAKFRVMIQPRDEVAIRLEVLSRDEANGAIEIRASLADSRAPQTEEAQSTLRATVIPRDRDPSPSR